MQMRHELAVKVVDNHKLCTNNVYNNLTGTPPVIFVDNTFMNCFPAVTSSTVEPQCSCLYCG